jgi:cholesterol transport system auxiliary component
MSTSSQTAACACLALIMASAAGCLDLKKSYPEKRSFVLDVGTPQQETPAKGTIVLKINKFRVSPLFAGRAMVYRVADLQYESDFYDEWFVAPGTLVTQQAHQWLSLSGSFQIVVAGTNHVEPTHLLEGTVTEFYGDFRGTPRAVFGLELYLLDAMHERRPFFRRTYHQDVPLTERSSDALARGLTEALRVVLADVAKDIVAVEPDRPQNAAHP